MGDSDGLATLLANESDKSVCLMVAEALVDLGDERGQRYIDHLDSKRISND